MDPPGLEEGGDKGRDDSASHEPAVIAGVDSDSIPVYRYIGPKIAYLGFSLRGPQRPNV